MKIRHNQIWNRFPSQAHPIFAQRSWAVDSSGFGSLDTFGDTFRLQLIAQTTSKESEAKYVLILQGLLCRPLTDELSCIGIVHILKCQWSRFSVLDQNHGGLICMIIAFGTIRLVIHTRVKSLSRQSASPAPLPRWVSCIQPSAACRWPPLSNRMILASSRSSWPEPLCQHEWMQTASNEPLYASV